MTTIAQLSKYAEATGNTLEIVGNHTPLMVFTNRETGEKELRRFGRIAPAYVAIKDARTGNHWISYNMLEDGFLYNFSRRNWINGATQKTFKKQFSWEDHVNATISA